MPPAAAWLVLVPVVVGLVLVVVTLVSVTGSRVDERRRHQLHLALRAVARLVAHDLGMHRTGVALGGAATASSFIPHFGQLPGSSLTTSGCIGQA